MLVQCPTYYTSMLELSIIGGNKKRHLLGFIDEFFTYLAKVRVIPFYRHGWPTSKATVEMVGVHRAVRHLTGECTPPTISEWCLLLQVCNLSPTGARSQCSACVPCSKGGGALPGPCGVRCVTVCGPSLAIAFEV